MSVGLEYFTTAALSSHESDAAPQQMRIIFDYVEDPAHGRIFRRTPIRCGYGAELSYKMSLMNNGI